MVYSYNEILVSNKTEQTTDMCNNMSFSQKLMWNEGSLTEKATYSIIFSACSRAGKTFFVLKEIRTMVVSVGNEGEDGL